MVPNDKKERLQERIAEIQAKAAKANEIYAVEIDRALAPLAENDFLIKSIAGIILENLKVEPIAKLRGDDLELKLSAVFLFGDGVVIVGAQLSDTIKLFVAEDGMGDSDWIHEEYCEQVDNWLSSNIGIGHIRGDKYYLLGGR
ncbi:MAG: hypothetical protein LBL86_04055 [Coriobacteriales bacterium]|jgi:hypothetical protein|nr:hypothetical protein [Coriobacteriales bacterium]